MIFPNGRKGTLERRKAAIEMNGMALSSCMNREATRNYRLSHQVEGQPAGMNKALFWDRVSVKETGG